MDQKQHDQNLDDLIRVYQSAEENEIALFLGAGVNGGKWANQHKACGSWPELIKQVARNYHEEQTIQAILDESGDSWVKAATRFLGGCDPSLLINQIDDAVYQDIFTHPHKRIERAPKHRVLEWRVFEKMPTLRAVVAFTAAINDPTKERSMCRNPKVGCVLTTNYDFFFGAAWPRYTSMKWRPRTWKSESSASDDSAPIIYLHGYLPYSQKGNRNVVLLEEQYEQAYQTETPAKFEVIRELKYAIENYSLIFVGFSFTDPQVMNVLREASSSKHHFAFLGKDETSAIEAANGVRVVPIEVSNWDELPEKLRDVYCAGIPKVELERTGLLPSDYWLKLWKAQEPRTKSKM